MIWMLLILMPRIVKTFKLSLETGKTGVLLYSFIYTDGTCEERHKISIICSHRFALLLKLKGDN